MSHILSKSSFIRGCQCIKSMYLNKVHPELKDKISARQQAIFDRGHSVGYLAQKLFPDGIDLQLRNQFDFDKSIEELTDLLKEDSSIIYEAPFIFNEVLSILDILVNDNGYIKAYEVKSSTGISNTYLLDAALQYWVITNSGINLSDFSLIHINNKYTRKGEIDIHQLFKIESVLDRILPLQPFIEENTQKYLEILKGEEIPDIDIGPHCDNPYPCDFHGYCLRCN